jgi:hypothetical protein
MVLKDWYWLRTTLFFSKKKQSTRCGSGHDMAVIIMGARKLSVVAKGGSKNALFIFLPKKINETIMTE